MAKHFTSFQKGEDPSEHQQILLQRLGLKLPAALERVAM